MPALSILAQAASSGAPSAFNSLIPIACMAVIFYFLLIRPQQKKQKELQTLISSVKTGDKVITSGGIHGIVSNVKDGATLTLKISDNVKIELDKSAIASVDRGASQSTSAAAPVAALK